MRPQSIHHIHKRKRKAKKLAPYPHHNKWIKFLDDFLLVVAVVAPLVNIPQVLKILREQSAIGVSLLSWSLYTLLAIPWLVYGIVHRELPIIVANALWIILDLAVVVCVLLYG